MLLFWQWYGEWYGKIKGLLQSQQEEQNYW